MSDTDPDDALDADDPPFVPRRGPSAFMRFIVVVFGFLFMGLGGALADAGGPIGWVLAVITFVLGLGVVAIAVGLVEWIVRRRRPVV